MIKLCMKKQWLLLAFSLLFSATFTHAADNTGACNRGMTMDGISACPQANLSRGAETPPLSVTQQRDDLSYSKHSHYLSLTRHFSPLSRSPETANLSLSKQQDFLARSPDTPQLAMNRTRHELSYSKKSDDLSISKQSVPLSRSVVTHDLSMTRVRDDLSRGADTAPLSRCD